MIILRGGGQQVTLRSPEFNDEQQIDGGLKLKKMMDRSKRSFISNPVTTTYNLTFTNMNLNKVEELRLFVIATAGQQLQMVDHNRNLWRGHILTSPMVFTHARIRDNQFTFTFEGHIFGKEGT